LKHLEADKEGASHEHNLYRGFVSFLYFLVQIRDCFGVLSDSEGFGSPFQAFGRLIKYRFRQRSQRHNGMPNRAFFLCNLQDIMSPETRIEEAAEINGDLCTEEVECSDFSTGMTRGWRDVVEGQDVGLPEDDF
jgi:hypothetical protein